jgi:CSLREA domain-containing protein
MAENMEARMHTIRSISKAIIILAVIFTMVGFSPALSPGVTITVTTFQDEYNDTDTGCSLREAITAANTNAAFGGCPAGSDTETDTIVLPADTYTFTRFGSDDTNIYGDLDIQSTLNLTGAGMDQTIIDAAQIDRVIHIAGAYTVTITGLTLKNGLLVTGNGGGLLNNSGTITLTNIRISDSQAGDGAFGGGISNNGTIYMDACIIEGNAGGDTTTVVFPGYGGGIYNKNSATMTIDHTVIRDNRTGSRGQVVATTNEHGGLGGGIHNEGVLTINHSLISFNRAGDITAISVVNPYCVVGGYGGGISNVGSLTVTNTTIAGNSGGNASAPGGSICVLGGGGGGISGFYATETVLESDTIYGNTRGDGVSVSGAAGGLILYSTHVSIHNTILTGNEYVNCTDLDGTSSLVSGDYNIITSNICPISGTTTHNLAVDPLLSSLVDNRGPTQTLALLAGSPAIDKGDPADCPTTDQRGFYRPVDGDAVPGARCDIGAFEYGYTQRFIPLIFKLP